MMKTRETSCMYRGVSTFLGYKVNKKIDKSQDFQNLMRAIADRDSAKVKELIELCTNTLGLSYLCPEENPLNEEDKRGFTPLYLAALDGLTEIVGLLADAGADLNYICNGSLNALQVAVQENHIDTVKILMRAGADFRIKDAYDQTPLAVAKSNRSTELVEILTLAAELEDGIFIANIIDQLSTMPTILGLVDPHLLSEVMSFLPNYQFRPEHLLNHSLGFIADSDMRILRFNEDGTESNYTGVHTFADGEYFVLDGKVSNRLAK